MKNQILLSLFVVLSKLTFSQSDFNTTKGFGIETSGFGKSIDYSYSISANCTYKINKHLFFVGGYMNNAFKKKSGEYGSYFGYRIYPHKNLKKIKVYYQLYYCQSKLLNDNQWQGHFAVLGIGIHYNIISNLYIGSSLNLGPGYVRHFSFDSGWNWWLFQPKFTLSYLFVK